MKEHQSFGGGRVSWQLHVQAKLHVQGGVNYANKGIFRGPGSSILHGL